MIRLYLLLLLLTLPACGRASITFALGESDPALHERTVIDEGWGPKVAQIDIRGLLIDSPRPTLLGTSDSPVDELVARLDKAAKDPAIRAVILRINSPGGGVAASETMYAEVRRFREESGKPVVASLGEVAASGGYYLALAADEIVAQPTTITGSIGVIIPTVNISTALERWGVRSRSITSGPNKDMANPLEPAEEPHYALLQGMVDEFYSQFRGLVAERRSSAITAATGPDAQASLATHTDGRVFTGAQAARLGFADRTGSLRDAFDRAKSLAKLDKASLVRYHSEGDAPRTAYARADDHAGDINLLKLDIGETLLGMPAGGRGAYYLWAPSAP
jgi:protease-4